jgi:hypothetical protein
VRFHRTSPLVPADGSKAGRPYLARPTTGPDASVAHGLAKGHMLFVGIIGAVILAMMKIRSLSTCQEGRIFTESRIAVVYVITPCALLLLPLGMNPSL